MQTIVLRRATVQDAARVTEIYNSNPLFLEHHLGRCRVEEAFILHEMQEMKRTGFFSYLFVELPTGNIVGLADMKADSCAYLSLMMLDSRFQKSGKGAFCYVLLERELRRCGAHTVRIDVVCEYPENVKGFWTKQGFLPTGTTRLLWNGKESEAIVMHKQLD